MTRDGAHPFHNKVIDRDSWLHKFVSHRHEESVEDIHSGFNLSSNRESNWLVHQAPHSSSGVLTSPQ